MGQFVGLMQSCRDRPQVSPNDTIPKRGLASQGLLSLVYSTVVQKYNTPDGGVRLVHVDTADRAGGLMVRKRNDFLSSYPSRAAGTLSLPNIWTPAVPNQLVLQ